MKACLSHSWVGPSATCVVAAAVLFMTFPCCALEAEAPVLVPGDGWTGPTPQPDPVGSGAGADAKAIARWDVVPYQTFDGSFGVGVVAFHMNGIDRVEFSVENGPWAAVRRMTLNPRTKVKEYWVNLDSASFAEGPVEVRAVAYPKAGIPRVLAGDDVTIANGEHSIFLFANPGGDFRPQQQHVSPSGSDTGGDGTRERPFQTIARAIESAEDGGHIVLLEPGAYEGPSRAKDKVNTRWITIRPDAGVSGKEVTVVRPDWSPIRPKVALLRWENVCFNLGTFSQYYGEPTFPTWFERCHWFDEHGWLNRPDRTINVRGVYYAVDSSISDTLYAFTNAAIARGCRCDRISGDVWQNARLVINGEVDKVGGTGLPHHSDLYQMWNEQDNIILYGMTASGLTNCQSIFLQPTHISTSFEQRHALTNAAFVDLNIENTPVYNTAGVDWGGPPWSQMQSKFDHIYFRNVKLPNQRFMIRSDVVWPDKPQGWEAKNVLFQQVELHHATWEAYCKGEPPPGTRFESCTSAQ